MHSINQIPGLIVREDTSIISTNIQLLSKPTPSLWSNVTHYLTKSLCFFFCNDSYILKNNPVDLLRMF